MAKYKIYFTGERTYIASSEEQAIRMAETHLENLPKQFKLDIGGIKSEY